MTDRPSTYTHGHHASVLASHRWRTAENSAGYLLPHLRPGLSLLDVGCGPGTITADLARRVAPGSVLGIDPAAEVVDQARDHLAQSGVDNARVEAIDLDSLARREPAGRYDVVHAHQVLHHLSDPVGALRTMAELCRPGGLVAVRETDFHGMLWYPLLPELDRWMELFQAAARANGGEPDAGRRLLGWAHAAGLASVTPSASTWCFATEQDRAWWGGTWAERITSSALAEQLRDTGLADAEELAWVAAGWRRWAADPDGWMTVVHGEILCRLG